MPIGNQDTGMTAAQIEELEANTADRHNHTGFTSLGDDAPEIKMKKITGTCAGVSGTSTVAHGLTLSKIIGMVGLVYASSYELIPHQYNNDTFRWDYYVDSSDVIVRTGNAASGISGRPFTILFIYEE
jgi:hypothetical protein